VGDDEAISSKFRKGIAVSGRLLFRRRSL